MEAERAVLGSVLVDGAVIHKAIAEGLTEAHFGSLPNKKVWRNLCELAANGTDINQITLGDQLRSRESLEFVGGHAYLSTLLDDLPDPSAITDYVRVVRGEAFRRKVAELGQSIGRLPAGSFSNEQIRDKIHLLVTETTGIIETVATASTAQQLVDTLVEQLEEGEIDRGIKSGYPVLDMLLGGYRSGNLVVVAGRPGMGKTSLALNQAHIQLTRYGKRVGFFSMEMSGEEIITKVLAAETQIPVSKVRVGAFGESEWHKVAKARRDISQFPLFVDETGGLSVQQLQAKARELVTVHNVDIIYVDYLQLMGSGSRASNRTEEVSQISRGLKSLAKESGIPIVALSQLSRAVEQRPDKRPVLADLRESGSIEQDADSVMFVYRPGVYELVDTTGGETELILAKNRHGSTGLIPLAWEAKTNQFHSKT